MALLFAGAFDLASPESRMSLAFSPPYPIAAGVAALMKRFMRSWSSSLARPSGEYVKRSTQSQAVLPVTRVMHCDV